MTDETMTEQQRRIKRDIARETVRRAWAEAFAPRYVPELWRAMRMRQVRQALREWTEAA